MCQIVKDIEREIRKQISMMEVLEELKGHGGDRILDAMLAADRKKLKTLEDNLEVYKRGKKSEKKTEIYQ